MPHYHWTSDITENVDLHSVERAYAFGRRLIGRLDDVNLAQAPSRPLPKQSPPNLGRKLEPGKDE